MSDTERSTDRGRNWQFVFRDQCRPDELCVGCGREMGDTHDVLCYVMANARGNCDD